MFSVTQFGYPLDPGKYVWDSKNLIFTSDENNLVLDFSTYNFVEFKTRNYCTFVTGRFCKFDSGDFCIFNVGSNSIFNVGINCSLICYDLTNTILHRIPKISSELRHDGNLQQVTEQILQNYDDLKQKHLKTI